VILAAIAEAQLRGARLAQACRVVGISARTVERWRARPGGDDGRCGPHRRPHNALSRLEEAQVLSVLTSSRYATVSPKQLVPQLADEGLVSGGRKLHTRGGPKLHTSPARVGTTQGGFPG
jgi:putative transposase